MRKSRIGIPFIAIIMLMVACGSADFTGSGQSGNSGSSPSPTPNNPPPTTPTTTGGPTSSDPQPAAPSGQPTGPSTPSSSPAPAQNPSPSSGIQPGPNDQIVNTPTGVTFGKSATFHLGNGVFDGSTCQDQLKALPVSGKTYNFIFTVTADNTPVSISLTGLCGVDLDNNMVALQGNGVTVTPLAIPANTASMPFQSTSLNKGTYTISVTSAKNTDNPHFKMGDFDDFIISQVQLQGSNLQGVSFNVQP